MLRKNKLFILFSLVLISLFLNINLVVAGPAGFGKISIQSSFPGLNAPNGVWVFNWISDGYTTDKVRAHFTQTDIKADTGKTSKGYFDISIDGTENYCKYDIIRDADRLDVFTVSIETFKESYTWKSLDELKTLATELAKKSGCIFMPDYEDGWPGAKIINNGWIWDDVTIYCYKKKLDYGKIGTIRNLKYVTKTSWTVQAQDKPPETKTISNDDAGEGRTTNLGSNTIIQWQGQLSSGDTCPISTEELALHDGTTWKIINRQNYALYENYMKTFLDDLAKKLCSGEYTKEGVEQMINSKAALAAQEKSFSGFNVIITDSSITKGVLKINLAKLIRFPMFRLFVDSDYLELIIETGKPKVTCPSEKIEFRSGEIGKISVIAENIGREQGAFTLRVKSCDNGLEAGDETGFTLAAGTSATKILKVTSAVPEPGKKISGNCVIEMKESTTQETATCNANLEASGLATCTENNIWCGYDDKGKSAIIKCINGNPVVIKTCDYTCDYDEKTQPFCKAKENNGTNTTITKADCDKRALEQPWLGWVWVQKNEEVGMGPLGIGKLFGLTKKSDKSYCYASFMIYWTIGAIAGAFLITIIIVAITTRKKQLENENT